MADFDIQNFSDNAETASLNFTEDELKKLESKSNFVLKSDTVEDLGGPAGSSVLLKYTTDSNQHSFAGLLTEDPGSDVLGLFLKFSGPKLNDELFYMVLQNFRSMLRVPGIMIKGAGKELWVRISKRAKAEGIGLKQISGVLAARLKKEFPEIESVQVCFIKGKGKTYNELEKASEEFYQASEKLKAKVWADRGFNFSECHVLGHCGKCADKKLCANVRRIDRLTETHRINQ